VYGADGEWSSFGANAGNTREIFDGKAPVDGVEERWRVPAPGLTHQAPIAAGDRVYQPHHDELRVYDAADAAELWTAPGVDRQPLVRDGTAYVSTGSGVGALDAATGRERWFRKFETAGQVTSPAMMGDGWLFAGVGETLHRLDPASGETLWKRRLFGQILDGLASFNGYYVAAVTEAGMAYLLTPDGLGAQNWRLPEAPVTGASADSDNVYVSCRNGVTYALGGGSDLSGAVLWTAETGAARLGIGVSQGLVVVANGQEIHAIDAESGERRWKHRMGDWPNTAPAFGRDTMFVGGDRLWAFDPTPEAPPFVGGPAVRFENRFHGRVGPGPILNDGVLYVIAQTGPEAYHLLALDAA
jgi:outer membrane protein assembly factor BamB